MFNKIIGQSNLKKLLERSIKSAQIQNVSLPHFCLASGTGGTGKTMFVEETAREMNVKIHTLSASDATPDDIINAMRKLNAPNSIIFLEEWNSVNSALDYFLRPYLESGIITLNSLSKEIYSGLNEGARPRYNYTVAIATNNISVLPQPLQSRLRIFQMEEYTNPELVRIVNFHAERLGVLYEKGCDFIVASRSRGVPRNITKMLKGLRDEYIITSQKIDSTTCKMILDEMGIYHNGINRIDIAVLRLLNTAGSLSLSALSNATGESQETIRETEAFLIKNGFLTITNKRNITDSGRRILSTF